MEGFEMAASPESNAELREKLKASRAMRHASAEAMKAAAEAMKAAVERAVSDTPTDAHDIKEVRARLAAEEDETQASGVRQIPDAQERLDIRREQVEEARNARKSSFHQFKETVQAFTAYRETTLLDPEELRKKLSESGSDLGNGINGAQPA